jgi:hypothetical protein
MKQSSGGFWGRLKRELAPVETASRPKKARPAPSPDLDADADADPAELRFCCICGAQLSGDFEDELNGEGWGRDICGDCNRTKNADMEMGW